MPKEDDDDDALFALLSRPEYKCTGVKHKLPRRPVQILINSKDIYVPTTQ